jgi:type VI secretion system protein VasG
LLQLDLAPIIAALNDTCRHALEEASSLCISQQANEVSIAHVLSKLAENPYSDLRLILKSSDISDAEFKRILGNSFTQIQSGFDQYPSFSPLLIEAFQEAWLIGTLELTEPKIRSGTFMLALLLTAGRYLPLELINSLDGINRETLRKQFHVILKSSSENLADSAASTIGNNQNKDTGDTPLDAYGTNFTELAKQGKIDPVLCRDDEIDLMIDILSRRRKNNPIAVGDPGVGKSALVEGLALRIIAEKVPDQLKEVALWGLDLGALQAGASVKGEFEKRISAVLDQVKNSSQPIILFIDEAHTMIGAGNAEGGSDAANLLKPALARGELRTIAATTWTEYKKYFEKDPALSRRFQLVKLDEPSVEDSIHILRGLRSAYEASHKVYISDAALSAAAKLSDRYLSGRKLPDKAIDVLDTACARVSTAMNTPPQKLSRIETQAIQAQSELELLNRDQNYGSEIDEDRLNTLHEKIASLAVEKSEIVARWTEQKTLVQKIIETRASFQNNDATGNKEEQNAESHEPESTAPTNPLELKQLITELSELQQEHALIHADVSEKQISAVISDWTGIPATEMGKDQVEKLQNLATHLQGIVMGQDSALETIHKHLMTSLADLKRAGTPLGVFLLVGPSGVGKTETAVQIADYLFGGKQFLTAINMSEYQEKHSISRLIGSPPGYIGFGEGGVLSEAIRKKPYSVVLLDEVEKAHPEILTLFYQAFDKGEINDGEGRTIDCKNILFMMTSNIGFDGTDQDNDKDIDSAEFTHRLREFFKPALLARMQVLKYQYLNEDTMKRIVLARLASIQSRFSDRYKASLEFDQTVIEQLYKNCMNPASGARMLDASIEGELLPKLSMGVLTKISAGDKIGETKIRFEDNDYEVNFS